MIGAPSRVAQSTPVCILEKPRMGCRRRPKPDRRSPSSTGFASTSFLCERRAAKTSSDRAADAKVGGSMSGGSGSVESTASTSTAGVSHPVLSSVLRPSIRAQQDKRPREARRQVSKAEPSSDPLKKHPEGGWHEQGAGHVRSWKGPVAYQCSSLREVPRALVDQPSLELGDAGEHRQRKRRDLRAAHVVRDEQV